MRCHPTRWLWGLIPIAMLSWLAVHLETDFIQRDLETRSARRSRGGLRLGFRRLLGARWSARGAGASARLQREEAAALVRTVWGVRAVETRVADIACRCRLPIAAAAEDIAPRNDRRRRAQSRFTSRPPTSLGAGGAPATTVQARTPFEPAAPTDARRATTPKPRYSPRPSRQRRSPSRRPPVAVNAEPHARDRDDARTAALPEQKAARGRPVLPASGSANTPCPPEQQTAAVAANAPRAQAETATPGRTSRSDARSQARAGSARLIRMRRKRRPRRPPPPMPERAPRFETAALPRATSARMAIASPASAAPRSRWKCTLGMGGAARHGR